ncbi:MAG: cache domain-containing protein [Pseudodesulfovibrio sp.]
MRKLSLAVVVCISLLFASVALGEDKDQAVKVVNAVAAFYEAHGKDATIAELCKPVEQGAFKEFAPLYAFAYDANCNMVAHFKTQLVGRNYEKLPDVKGKMFRKDIVDSALKDGEGWTDYWYKNPATGKLAEKTTYAKKVGDLIVACGVYK